MKSVYLKKNEERRILAGHLWIYSNEIDVKRTPLKNFSCGELVEIKSSQNKTLGIGYINPHNLLCVRLLSRKLCTIDSNFFLAKIERALAVRERSFPAPNYRLIFSEGDFLPGLIVDRYRDILVVQLNTMGMEQLKQPILEALIAKLNPRAIVIKNSATACALEGVSAVAAVVYGDLPEIVTLEENAIQFNVDILRGQKTGWFFDQRANRARLYNYVRNQRVLDVFSYVGAFGVGAAVHGAKQVVCVDASETALTLARRNAALNHVAPLVTTQAQDAFHALKTLHEDRELFDVIILDPPAFIKKQKDLKTGMEAYLRLHELALQILAPMGILCTTSCSLHLTRDLLLDLVRQAGLNTKCALQVLEQLHQGADHPIHPAIVETNYLKGFIGLKP